MREFLWLSEKTFRLFMSIFNHKCLIVNHANSFIASIGQTKTDYEMSFNHAIPKYLREKWGTYVTAMRIRVGAYNRPSNI